MNSKLFSRIAALVLCVVMLITVSFAAPTAVLGVNNDQFTIAGDDDYKAANEQMTMMAYTVEQTVADAASIPAYSGQKIVALDQMANDASFGTVEFNKNKIAADKKLAVVLGGTSGGDVLKILLATEDIHLVKNVTNGVESLATANTIDDMLAKLYKCVKIKKKTFEVFL